MKRRAFLKTGIAAGGGFIIGFSLPAASMAAAAKTQLEINAWLTIGNDDTVVIRVAKVELGQGVMTALPMIIAEELEVDFANVRTEFVDVNRHIAAGAPYGSLVTGDSNAIRGSREMLQQVGAEARERLLLAAAVQWGVPPSECRADYGEIKHSKSRQRVSYGEIAELAANVTVSSVTIKTPEAFNFLGLPTPGIEAAAMVSGATQYAMDVRLPGMAYAAIALSPVVGGTVRSLRSHAIRGMPGVIDTVRLDDAIAVVAGQYWQAKKALDALPKFWDTKGNEKHDSQTFQNEFVKALDQPGQVLKNQGETERTMDLAEKTIESDYVVPYLAQAPMEPLNCTVQITAERVDLWVGHQDPEALHALAMRITGKAAAAVHIHICHAGGSFGRRSHVDFVEQALRVAMEVEVPVQVIWSREEEMRGGRYRPMAAVRFKAAFDLERQWIAYANHSVTHSIQADAQDGWADNQIDGSSVEGLLDMPYHVTNRQVSHTRLNTFLTSWWWRSAGHSQNCFAMECFVDEMAATARLDPIQFRRRYLSHRPDLLAVLNTLEEKSKWRATAGRGRAIGVALHECFGTICGQVAEVSVNRRGAVVVHRIVCVVDCGNLVNELGARAQVEGGIVYGMSAALFGKLSVDRGVVLENNFDTYRVVTMADMPEIEVHFANSGGKHWGGLGEVATPPVAPAICNALFKITGRRIRSLPLKDYILQA